MSAAGRLDGRIVVVTGAGSGLGRAHALHLAREGASVVVNDLGTDVHGRTGGASNADVVVREIEEIGGRAVASSHDVADWDQASELVSLAVESFGALHGLVNNAGILRDRTLANMSEEEFDAVIRVHLKGHAAPTAHAMAYWRDRAKAGENLEPSVVHTSSIAGITGNFGQGNYAAAKAAVIGLSRVVALEGRKMGVRSNAVSPSARTRLAQTISGADALIAPPDDPNAFDRFDPANISPLVSWLMERTCPANDQLFHLVGEALYVFRMPEPAHIIRADGRWTAQQLDAELVERLVSQLPIETFIPETTSTST